MTNRTIVLHIGAPKCGSSALQAALTRRPNLKPTQPGGQQYAYWAFRKRGRAVTGKALTPGLRASPFGYANGRALAVDTENLPSHTRIAPGFEQILQDSPSPITPVMSDEAWMLTPDLFQIALADMPRPPQIHALSYIRSPASWLNSAWWQWGAWTNSAPNHWMKQKLQRVRWADHLRKWQAIPEVKTLEVFLSNRDVVSHFHQHLGVRKPRTPAVNMMISNDLLEFLQRNRAFRVSPHSSQTEFILARHVTFSGPKPAFALERTFLDYVLKETAQPNKDLAAFLSKEEFARLEAQDEWWRADAFEKKLQAAADPAPENQDRLIADLEACWLSRRLGQVRLTRHKLRPLSATEDTATARHIALLINRIRAADLLLRERRW